MRIKLSEFSLPGTPGIDGDVVYKAIDYDINSGVEFDGYITHSYLVCGWREDDGAGVLIHGTPTGLVASREWRIPRLISAPDDPSNGLTIARTEFHNVESLEGPFLRLTGCVESVEDPGKKQGFLYEGPYDGDGDWYPLNIEGAENTIVKGSRGGILVCSDTEISDSVYVYSLQTSKWEELHSGYADPWDIEEIIAADGLYVIRLQHSDGKRSDVVYRV